MRILICTILIYFTMIANCVQANGVNLEFSLTDDSRLSSRLWYDDRLIWSIVFTGAEYAEPVMGKQHEDKTVVVTPEINDGFFVFKLH